MREFIAKVFGKHLTKLLLRRRLSATLTLNGSGFEIEVGFTYKPDDPDDFSHTKFATRIMKVIEEALGEKDAEYFVTNEKAVEETVAEITQAIQSDQETQAFSANVESVTIEEITIFY